MLQIDFLDCYHLYLHTIGRHYLGNSFYELLPQTLLQHKVQGGNLLFQIVDFTALIKQLPSPWHLQGIRCSGAS